MSRLLKKIKNIFQKLLSYLAVLGCTSFPAILFLVFLGILTEIFRPGLIFNQLSPQILASLMVIFGIFALLPLPKQESIFRRILFGGFGLVVSVIVYLLSSSYFYSLNPVDWTIMVVACFGISVLVTLSSLSVGRPTNNK